MKHRLILLISLGLLTGCSEAPPSPPMKFERPIPAAIAEVTVKDIPVYIEAIGNVTALAQVDVRPQVTGKVVRLFVKPGQDVQAGQILYQIDPVPYQLQLEKAQATLEKDLAKLEYTRQRLNRYERLMDSQFVSRLSIDEYRSDVRTQESQIKIDQAEVRLAEINLSYTNVISPLKGQISLNLVDEGNIITGGETNALTRILQMTPIYVCFNIAQREFQQIQESLQKGDRRFAAFLPHQDRQFEGEVVAVDNQIDPQTGTIQIKGLVTNQDQSLWPGEFVRVKLFLKTKKNMPVVPASAIQANQKGSFVYTVLEDHSIEMVPVKVGEEIEGVVAIEEGLKEGMKVVTDGQLNLRPGVKVVIASGEAFK